MAKTPKTGSSKTPKTEPIESEEEVSAQPSDSATGSARSAKQPTRRSANQASAPVSDAAQPAPESTSSETHEEQRVETITEETTGGGRKETRRWIHKSSKVESTEEDIEEDVTEYIPPSAYQAPASNAHPAPVG